MASPYALLASFELPNSSEDTQKLGITTSNGCRPSTAEAVHTPISKTSSKHYLGADQNVTIFEDNSYIVQDAQRLKEFKNVLISSNSSDHDDRQRSLAALILIDAVLRLGIEYHFQEEIEVILQKEYLIFTANHHDGTKDCNNIDDQELHEVALRFRLLRQGGYNVSADVFNKFKDIKGKFNPALAEDKEGLMQLFEASQLSFREEHILEEAEDFSRYHLTAWLNRLENDGARTRICKTLEQPYHKSLARVTARNIDLKSLKGVEEHWVKVLEQVAEADFRMVRSIHQEEIVMISRWWEELGLAKELRFARDQPLKWYLWTVATLGDPSFSEHRIELTKPISLVYIIDDIFDVYGTLDQLTLFTDAVNKWEITATEKLPDHFKICFKALDDTTNEIAHKVHKKHGWNPIDSLRRAWAKLCNAFLLEAEWFASKKLPNEEEYLKTAIVSSGVHLVLVHLFFLLGQGITKEAVHLLDEISGPVSPTATILRLWDDLGNAKDENQSGHDGSYVECYMKGNEQECTVEEAREHVIKMIKKEWKRLNQECRSTKEPFPMCFKKACLNVARMVPNMYDYDDDHRLPGLEDYVKSLLSE